MTVAFVAQDGQSTVTFCKEFVRALRNRGHEDVYTISPVDDFAEEITALGSQHLAVGTGRFLSPVRDLRYVLQLRRRLKALQVDMVITFGTKPNLLGALAARLARTRCLVVGVRGRGRVFTDRPGVAAWLLHAVVRRLYQLAFDAATRVWFTNEGDREYFLARRMLDGSRTFLTKNSVDTAYFAPSQVSPEAMAALRRDLHVGPDDFVVVMVGRLIWAKGVRELVDAAIALREEGRIRFVLVAPGEPPGIDMVPEEFVRAAEREANLTWLGFRKDVRTLYAIANVAVLPSYYKEGGYPRALLEPMALGKPVIAADTDECRSPVRPGENGFLVPPRDAAALVARILDLYRDAALCQRFGERSRERVVREFDDRLVVAEVLDTLGL